MLTQERKNMAQVIYDDLNDKLFLLRFYVKNAYYTVEDENGIRMISRYHMIECFYEGEWEIIEQSVSFKDISSK